LDYAAIHNLTPLAMAEFWYGKPSPDGYKVQGEFYGACVERCQPLMGFLLSGRRSLPDPLKKEQEQIPLKKGEEIQVPLFKGDLGGSLPVIYEDEYLIAIAKPAGLLSVPGRYLDTQDSVYSRLCQLFGDTISLYPVHRLDRQTSGILLFARDLDSLRNLHQQFQQRKIHKVYEALLSGKCAKDRGTIDLPLWGNPENRPYQQVDFERGKPSVTEFQVIGYEAHYSRIEFVPLTGRTHQLRVHAADRRGLGLTILGDRLYGCRAATDRLHLHARELTFVHPRSQEVIHLQIPVPFT
jgi:tRNA pseudouridine32 synthase/23S rRNA pseudouridine746 synthase